MQNWWYCEFTPFSVVGNVSKKHSLGSASEITLYAQDKNPGESYIMLDFHFIRGLITHGKWTWESPAF